MREDKRYNVGEAESYPSYSHQADVSVEEGRGREEATHMLIIGLCSVQFCF